MYVKLIALGTKTRSPKGDNVEKVRVGNTKELCEKIANSQNGLTSL
jgi:hypothetical protein